MKKLNDKIEFLRSNYNFRYNEVNSKVEFKLLTEEDYKPLEDRNLNSIFIQMAQNGIESGVNELRIIINSNLMPIYHPFTEYFNNLPKLKGTENIDKLIATVNTHDDEFFKWSFTKWIVAWVACMIDNEIINHQCVILSGLQGIGKSTWVENLIPNELIPYYYAGNIKLGNKDTLGLLSDKCLINLDELASMTYSNVTELKELVTKSNITYRKPYGYFTETFIRRASFIGSVNGTEFLYDLTGNRRFLSFEVNSFENYGNHNVDMNLVLAEAYNLYKDGFQYWFDAEDQERVEKNNESFIVLSYEEIQLLKHYAPKSYEELCPLSYHIDLFPQQGRKESNGHYSLRRAAIHKILDECNEPKYMRVSELYKKIASKKGISQGDLVKFGKILNKNGFERRRTRFGAEYKVYRTKPDFSRVKEVMDSM